MKPGTTLLVAAASCALLAGPGSSAAPPRQAEPPRPPAGQAPPPGFEHMPDLVAGLKAIDGCLGVETARTRSGKNVIFAWFRDRKAALQWYYSEVHMGAMDLLMDEDAATRPLAHVPEDSGPIMVIASLTPADERKLPGVDLPISQIAIELYRPLPGGAFIGGRFAPPTLEIEHMRDYTPQPPAPPTDRPQD